MNRSTTRFISFEESFIAFLHTVCFQLVVFIRERLMFFQVWYRFIKRSQFRVRFLEGGWFFLSLLPPLFLFLRVCLLFFLVVTFLFLLLIFYI